MQRTALPAPTATWTVTQAVEHYRTFTTARLANTHRELAALGASSHPDVAVGLTALAAIDEAFAPAAPHSAEPEWHSTGFKDYRWECGCGRRYGDVEAEWTAEVNGLHAAHLADAGAFNSPLPLPHAA